MMSRAPRIFLSLTGLAALGLGVALWAEYGRLVYFDTLAAAFIGCFI
jgi:hypothetical protein